MIGRTLTHYTVTAELGAGAMGRVYLARDEHTDRSVALKLVDPSLAADAEAHARLLREARAAARLLHPNIVALLAVEEADGESFLVEEYVDGEPLERRLQRGPLEVEETLRLARELTAALAHAHRHGVLHRDLKPSNVLIAADGTFKVADFGIARIEGGATTTSEGRVLGTPAYMAPERIRGNRGDARADLFSLGAVLYEALTGRRAFSGRSQAEVLYSVLNEVPPPPAVASASLLPLAALVAQLMEKDPRRRPASAEAVASALECLDTAAPALLRRRPRWAWPVAASVVAVLAVAAALTWWVRMRPAASGAVEASVAVLYFENLPDPPDGARLGPIATNLLVTALAQAPGLGVLGTQRVLDAMRQTGRGPAALDRAAGLLVARRARATRIVTGSVLQIAPVLVVTAEVSDVRSGRVLWADRVEGAPGETVFQVVDALGARLLRKMAPAGESAALAPVATRTSGDLEAQRRYVEGIEALAGGRLEAADSAFTAALGRDSSFAQAWYQLAMARWWSGEPNVARAAIRRALEASGRLSPLERGIAAGLSELVEGRPGEAVARFEQLDAGHPGDNLVLYGLEEARYHDNDMEGAIAVARRLLALDPGFVFAGRHLIDALRHTGRYDEARTLGEEMLHRAPRSRLLVQGLAWLAIRRLDLEALIRLQRHGQAAGLGSSFPELALYAVSRDSLSVVPGLLRPAEARTWDVANARLGAAYFAALRSGQFREALRVSRQAWRLPVEPGHGGPGSLPWADGFWPAVRTGDSARAFEYSDSLAARLGRSGAVSGDFYRTANRIVFRVATGRLDEARRLLETLGKLPGAGSEWALGIACHARARIYAAEGRFAEALDELRRARWFGFPITEGTLLLDRARLESGLGRHGAALALLDSLVRCPMVYPDDAVRLHLDRGCELEALGRPAEAAAAYREFLRIWRDADPGRPEVAAARAALARMARAGHTVSR